MTLYKLLFCLTCITSQVLTSSMENKKQDWWKNGVFYQIYPRSFMDSNGDGIGDLQGIISKLDHLKDIGVTLAWLSPIFKSPQVDTGYDISDYKDIHHEYGTMADFDEMVQKANELGIKLVMDLVPNHSSDQHEWFKKSERREPGYEDYYVWADGKNNDDVTPPNNWISVFKYSAWNYSSIRKQWYFHQFAPEQPDLNFENPKVVEEMKDVMKFWMDRGVYGFRVDAVPHMAETGLEDEPLSGNIHATEIDWEYLDHIYTKDQPRTFELVYEFRQFLDDYNKARPDEDDRIMMTECYTDIKTTMRYYGDGDKLGAHMTFNFQLIPVNLKSTARDIVMNIQTWLTYMPRQFTPNWVMGNHDNPRLATRIGPKNLDGFNMLLAMLPGVAVTYNGEEIGMENGYVPYELGQDPSAINGPEERFNETSRDFERTPFHWDDSKNAGFSTADKTWLPVSEKYVDTNLAQQKGDEHSHYNIYKFMVELRKSEVLKRGKFLIQAYSDNVILVLRTLKDGREGIVLAVNIGDSKEDVDLNEVFDIKGELEVAVSSNRARGKESLKGNRFELQPHESLIGIES